MQVNKTAPELLAPQQRLDTLRSKAATSAKGNDDALQALLGKSAQKAPASGTEVHLGRQTIKSDFPLYSQRGDLKTKPAPPGNTGPLPPNFPRLSADQETTQAPPVKSIKPGDTRPSPLPEKPLLLARAPEPIPHIGLAPMPLIDLE